MGKIRKLISYNSTPPTAAGFETWVVEAGQSWTSFWEVTTHPSNFLEMGGPRTQGRGFAVSHHSNISKHTHGISLLLRTFFKGLISLLSLQLGVAQDS